MRLIDLSTGTLIAARELHVIAASNKTREQADPNYNAISEINHALYEKEHGHRFDLRPMDERGIVEFEREHNWSTE